MDSPLFETVDQALQIQLPPFYHALAQEFGLASQGVALTDLTTLYGLDELVERNRTYEVQRYLPGYLLIGDNSGGGGILLSADGSGDSAIYTCGLGALAPDELAVLAMSVAHWRTLGWPSDGHVWYAPRYLTEQLNSTAWQAKIRQSAIDGFLHQQLAELESQRAEVDAKDYLQRKRVLQWLRERAAADGPAD